VSDSSPSCPIPVVADQASSRPGSAYDAVYGVKDSPATMALPGALVGRFTDWDPPVSPDPSPRPPVALSRRAKARLRAAQGR